MKFSVSLFFILLTAFTAFPRKAVGAMDYTPVTSKSSQYLHITSCGHELALSVDFESGLQHMAGHPEGYYELPDAAGSFLKELPCSRHQIKYVSGYTGSSVMIARKKEGTGCLGGIGSAQGRVTVQQVNPGILVQGVQYRHTLISDVEPDKAIATRHRVVDSKSNLEVKLLRCSGMAAPPIPIQQ